MQFNEYDVNKTSVTSANTKTFLADLANLFLSATRSRDISSSDSPTFVSMKFSKKRVNIYLLRELCAAL